MKKALMMASVASMIDLFNMDNIKILRDMGFEVHVACNFEYGSITSQERVDKFRTDLENNGIKTFHIPVPRSMSAIKNIVRSYNYMKKLCAEHNYQIVHCHSPIGGVIARMACRNLRKYGTNVIYTAHGFHFFKGAPLKNWLMYYPVERYLSKFTDILITINKEDFRRAYGSFNSKSIQYVPGIGLDTKKIELKSVNRVEKRNELGINNNGLILLSVGEINKNKNHETVVRALSKINNSNIYYVICGKGPLDNHLRKIIKELGMEKQIMLLGYRTDIVEIAKVSDIFVFPSFREGLSVALMEAMACGLPIVCSNIRGNNDLVKDRRGGYLVTPSNTDMFASAISKLISDKRLCIEMGEYNKEKIVNCDIRLINEKIKKIYNN
ncbi:glycosyltransferase [Bacillus mangrovi]|uniref:Glycosyltransferase n=1 Tax=Metabacillus mangrovi TaxID=1491830 RepID=A0A7X2S7A4_9BACI|nr:glycosyltransferase family 4 protein [Metabacillus mangrovi]MTH54506.1 glycosyltransferase [Metabacillus mangrovi]